jgi:hypothetical protein
MIDGLIFAKLGLGSYLMFPAPSWPGIQPRCFLAKSLSKSDKHIVFRSENWLSSHA